MEVLIIIHIYIFYVLNYMKSYHLTDYHQSIIDGPEPAVLKLLWFAAMKPLRYGEWSVSHLAFNLILPFYQKGNNPCRKTSGACFLKYIISILKRRLHRMYTHFHR